MAKVKILVEGYYFIDSEGRENSCSTVSLVTDKDIVMVIDPGTLKDKKVLIDALANEGLSVDDVNFVCITHSHIDHYKNVGMFPNAKVLEYFGLWDGDKIEDWQEKFTEDIQILKTPGHDYSCITIFIKTEDGIIAICGDVFWKENYPETDPYAQDIKKLEHSRQLVLKMSHWIIPGHAGIYKTQNGRQFLKSINGKKIKSEILGNCRKCHKPFLKIRDKCFCQEWLCYRCCQCEIDCASCNCKVRRNI